MGLPASQQRALNQIEKTLADDHPGLGPLFAIFTRLAGHEAMPVTERVAGRPWWRRIRPGVVTVVGLAMATGALLTLSLSLSGPQACAQGRAIPVAAHMQSVPAGRQPGCAPRQNSHSETSQSGRYAH